MSVLQRDSWFPSEQWFLLSSHRAVKSVLGYHWHVGLPWSSQCHGSSQHPAWSRTAHMCCDLPHTLIALQTLFMKSKLILSKLFLKLSTSPFSYCPSLWSLCLRTVHLVLYCTTMPWIKLYLSAMQRKLCVQQSIWYIVILFTLRCNKSDTQKNYGCVNYAIWLQRNMWILNRMMTG